MLDDTSTVRKDRTNVYMHIYTCIHMYMYSYRKINREGKVH